MKQKSGQRLKVSSKTKKPDQQTYVVPSARANDDTGEYFRLILWPCVCIAVCPSITSSVLFVLHVNGLLLLSPNILLF